MYIRKTFAGLLLAAGILVAGSGSAQAQTPSDVSVAPANYTVVAGDYLAKIAAEYETTYVRLFDANPAIADPDVINPGQNIRIPAPDEQLQSRLIEPASAPVAQTKKVTSTTSKKPARPTATASGDVWARLAACESGGNPAINTGNGYYGAYQFSASTWRSVGGSGLPHQASLEEQTARAQALQARSGWGQWPACSAKLGLR
jgi:LysM repeat protein